MATIRKFEDLEIWQLARKLNQLVFSFAKKESFSKDYKLLNQINAAAGSVMDNITEGFDRGGRKEFSNFLSIAKGSCGEVKSQLHRSLDRQYISSEEFQSAYRLADELNLRIQGLMRYLNASDVEGQKYRSRVNEPDTNYGLSDIDLDVTQ